MNIHRLLTSGFLGSSIAVVSACGGGYGSGGGYSSPPPVATVTINAVPTTIIQGQSVALNWTSNGSACTASGAWSGAQAANGTANVSPNTVGNNTFTITCSGNGYATNTASAAVTVTAASAFTKSNLVVSDGSLPNVAQDPLLLNPWGMASSATSTIWSANNKSQAATLYDGTGIAQTLVVQIPAGLRGNANATGIVFNGAPADFVVTSGTKSAGAAFIFAGEHGTVSGWSPAVDGTHAIKMYDDTNAAVFKGLAIANNGTANFLYAADFHNNKVVVLDRTFAVVTVPGGFTDATLPAGFAPFGIQTLVLQGQTRIVVTYAKQDAVAQDQLTGAGLGLVNIFDTNGTLVQHLVPVGGALNAPWGVALATDSFGTLSNKLLIGNFGSGVIDAYDLTNGQFVGSINDSTGAPIATPGLWGIAFGNGARNQQKNTLYFLAGINGQAGGLYGRLDLGATAPDIVAPTAAIATPAQAETVSGQTVITVNAHDNIGVTQVQFFAGTTSLGIVPTNAAAPVTFNWNTATSANGAVALTAQAKDAAGNVTTSTAVNVTVAN